MIWRYLLGVVGGYLAIAVPIIIVFHPDQQTSFIIGMVAGAIGTFLSFTYL